jgi:hypothetical protein
MEVSILMITTYQIRNVLRVYGNQLKKKSVNWQDGHETKHKPNDLVDISIEARRKQKLNEMSHDLILQMTPSRAGRESGQFVHSDHEMVQISGITHGK